MTTLTTPNYGVYSPYENPFGVGYYHGWKTGLEVTNHQVRERYPKFSPEDLLRYQDGRRQGAKLRR
jgi:hypothetical protein